MWIPTVPVPQAPSPASAPAASEGAPSVAEAGAGPDAGAARKGLTELKSPIVGTFYRAAAPDKEPFVDKGSRVSPDTVVCIIEAMKVMNEIRAEMAGEVVEILARNGDAVEFNQPLFLIRP
jgi:acetyl-CoA carboxylase biotin carboxyl carrier protein